MRDGFTYEGYGVLVAQDGATGLQLARTEKDLDLIILDVMLPQLRAAGNQIPIIMLTARGQEINKVPGPRTEADDYVTKPFSFLELMARVEAILRRTGKPPGTDRLHVRRCQLEFHSTHCHKGRHGALSLSTRIQYPGLFY